MVFRSNKTSSYQRHKEWKESKLIDINSIKQSAEYCFRLAKRGKSSGLIINIIDDFDVADQVLANLKYRDLEIDSHENGQIKFTNGAIIKIFTVGNKSMVKTLLGLDATVVSASLGDPRESRASKIFNF